MKFLGNVEGQSICLHAPNSFENARKGNCVVTEELDLYSPTPMLPDMVSKLYIVAERDDKLIAKIDEIEYVFDSVKRGLTPLSKKEIKELVWSATNVVFLID